MKRMLALLITLFFIVSSISIGNTKDEKIVAKITYKDNECFTSTLQPIVVITQPEDGAVVTDPHLVVLGYAQDEAGMNYWEWEWHYQGGSHSNSSYFQTAEYVEFRIDIYGLHPGWNLVIVRFKNVYGAYGEDSVNVTYNPPDTQPPTVTIDEPEDGQIYHNSNIRLRGVARDNVGVSQISYTQEWEGGSTGSSWPIEPPQLSYPFDIPITLHEGRNRIKVEASDAAGNVGEKDISVIYVKENLTVEADGPYKGNVGINIHFHGSASGGMPPYSWHWDFGDGSVSTEQNPIHAYSQEGTYIATLTVEDSIGEEASDTAQVVITRNLTAEANGPYFGKVNENIQFYGNASGGSPPYSWHWDFGDGSIATEQNPQHAYINKGVYMANLTVEDSEGKKASDIAIVTVYEELVVDADGPYGGRVNENIQFYGNASGGVPPYSWHWDFGDGSVATEQNPSHAYSIAGTYQASLRVQDSIGNVATDSTTVYVYEVDDQPPLVEITKPRGGLYLNNRKIMSLPLNRAIVIGAITIYANASDNVGIKNVEFYIDNVLKHTNYTMPYYWLWNETAMGKHEIKVVAYDFSGNDAMDKQKLWIFNT